MKLIDNNRGTGLDPSIFQLTTFMATKDTITMLSCFLFLYMPT